MLSGRVWFILGGIVLALGFAYFVARQPMDFRVYHYGARGVADGTRPVYGPTSGMGWPMHYRYPPLFLLLFAPLAILPLDIGAALWLLMKCGVLVFLVRRLWQQLGPPANIYAAWLIPFLIAGPYVIEDFRYGNAQFFVFALTAAALLEAESRPMRAAAALALAISIKVWPLFFVPCLLARRRMRVAAWSLGFTAFLTVLPAVYFGVGGTLELLNQWTRQEFSTQLGQNEIWFPNQSLRGVMMRYLTFIDYSQVPDSNYPLVQIATLEPQTVRTIWLVLVAAIYGGFLVLVRRTGKLETWQWQALAFCLVPLLQPFTQKYALVVLLWPAIILGRFTERRNVRAWALAAAAVVVVQPLIPGAALQRLLQVLGLDFLATVLLTVALAVALNRKRKD